MALPGCYAGDIGYVFIEIRERERERDYTYPALRLIQVLPGHPLADPKRENSVINTKEDKPMSQQRREQSPRQGSNDSHRSLANTSKQETKRV